MIPDARAADATDSAPAVAPAEALDHQRLRQALPAGLALLGVGALLVGLLLSFRHEPARAWGSVLVTSFYFLSFGLGALFFLAVHALTRAEWWLGLRRLPEALGKTLPWLAPLALLAYAGRHALYPWTHNASGHEGQGSGALGHGALVGSKALYLSEPFFLGRMLLIVVAWIVLARWMHKRQYDMLSSASFVIIFSLTFSLASFDWLMSLEPHWFSSIFAIYTFAGLFQSTIALLTLGAVLLRSLPDGHRQVRDNHLHDLGKLLFAFSTFWAYIWLSQYLLIWYSHLPEEIPFYITRTAAPWRPWFWLCLVLGWVVPFLCLMTRAAKCRPAVLGTVAGIVLIGHWLDLHLHVMPALRMETAFQWQDFLILIGAASLFIVLAVRTYGQPSRVPDVNQI